jgi:hypothetical protein
VDGGEVFKLFWTLVTFLYHHNAAFEKHTLTAKSFLPFLRDSTRHGGDGEGRYKGVMMVLQEWYKGATRVSLWCYTDVWYPFFTTAQGMVVTAKGV